MVAARRPLQLLFEPGPEFQMRPTGLLLTTTSTFGRLFMHICFIINDYFHKERSCVLVVKSAAPSRSAKIVPNEEGTPVVRHSFAAYMYTRDLFTEWYIIEVLLSKPARKVHLDCCWVNDVLVADFWM